MMHTLEIYPDVGDNSKEDILYYVEFSKWDEKGPLRWTLFQRQFMYSKEEWAKTEHGPLESNEVHPWNLGGGVVNEREEAMDMNTKRFLKFMVDALNKKIANSENPLDNLL